jgi:FtsZ-interacting cell division protein ZipA
VSTGLIIAIIVAVLIIAAVVFFVLPRARRTAQVKARERELGQRRERVATEHQETATAREREAEAAEQRSRMALAEPQRAEAQMHSERADMHQRGLADDELVEDHEREHFAPAMNSDADVQSEPREGGTAHQPANEYDRGRLDEREAEAGRFGRGDSDTTEPSDPERGARRI